MATNQIVIEVSAVQALRKGYNGISMTEWGTANKPAITIGSTFEIGGALFEVKTADADPDPAAAWAGLTNGRVYLYFDGTTWSVSNTAPTWDTDKQGWYSGSARCLASFNRTGGAWADKRIWKDRGGPVCADRLCRKVLPVGSWDMDTVSDVQVTHGLVDVTKILAVDVIIINDAATSYLPLTRAGEGWWNIDTGWGLQYVNLHRVGGSYFDSASFSTTPYNRGYITITYIE